MNQRQRLHNPYKLPFVVVLTLIWTGVAIWGAVTGHWVWLVLGVIFAAWCLPGLWVIVTGRGNPRWLRSPLDPPA
jgi:hypothetical protein